MNECVKCEYFKEKCTIDPRSARQNNLYWSCVELYRENKAVKDTGEIDFNFNTKDKCHTQIRWAVKYIDKESTVYLIDKNGNPFFHFELDSISFSTPHKKANQFYNDAMGYIAEELETDVDTLIIEAQNRMQIKRK